MRVLVTGGTGFIGRATARRLAQRGDHVRVLTRSATRAADLRPFGIEICEGDITRPPTLTGAMDGRDAVVHAAGVPGMAKRQLFEQVHVEGTGNVCGAARAAGVRRLVNIASQAVVFDGSDLIGVDESRPYPRHYLDPYSETKAAGERLAIRFHDAGGLSVISLRPCTVWGRGDRTILPHLVRLARSPLGVPCPGDGRNFEAISHIDNVVDCILAALDATAGGQCCFVQDDVRIGWRDFHGRQLQAAGVRPRFLRLPARPVVAAAHLLDRASERLGVTVPLAAFGARLASTSRHYDTTRAREDLRWRPRIDLEAGLADLSAWVAQVGGPAAVARM